MVKSNGLIDKSIHLPILTQNFHRLLRVGHNLLVFLIRELTLFT